MTNKRAMEVIKKLSEFYDALTCTEDSLIEHNAEVDEALNIAIGALKTLEDNYYYSKIHLSSPYGQNVSRETLVDLKMLYENATMYCDKTDEYIDIRVNHRIEVYHQPNTPILIMAHWTRDNYPKLEEISYKLGAYFTPRYADTDSTLNITLKGDNQHENNDSRNEL